MAHLSHSASLHATIHTCSERRATAAAAIIIMTIITTTTTTTTTSTTTTVTTTETTTTPTSTSTTTPTTSSTTTPTTTLTTSPTTTATTSSTTTATTSPTTTLTTTPTTSSTTTPTTSQTTTPSTADLQCVVPSGSAVGYFGFTTDVGQPRREQCESFVNTVNLALGFCEASGKRRSAASDFEPFECADIGTSSTVLKAVGGAAGCATALATLNEFLTEYAFGFDADLSCSPTGFVKIEDNGAACETSALVITDFMDSVQAFTTTVCQTSGPKQEQQHVLVQFGPSSCPQTDLNSLLTKLEIATSIANTREIRRDQITNITTRCFGTTLVAKAYSDVGCCEPSTTLDVVSTTINNTGVTVTLSDGSTTITSVLVIAANDESTTLTTTATTSATTTPTTTTPTTTATTTPVHGELVCHTYQGSRCITTISPTHAAP